MAIQFELRHTEGLSRRGLVRTPRGNVETPALLPVVNPNRPTVPCEELARAFGVQMVITNSYIIRSSDKLEGRAREEGVHRLIGFEGPVMTDSGTFQEYVYGDVSVEPGHIVEFQRAIGSDIGTILDVFSTPDRTRDEARLDVAQTLSRAMDAEHRAGPMALALPVQGATFPELRESAARDLAHLAPAGEAIHPIGGVVPLMERQRYDTLARIILGAKRGLHPGRPVHLFGAGHPHMLALAVYLGCDLFDSAAYAKFANDDRLLFPWGTERLEELEELPCECPACAPWSVSDLRAADPEDRAAALARHNLHATLGELKRVREAQRRGRLFDLLLERAVAHPALLSALDILQQHVPELEREEPLSHRRALSVVPPWHAARPHTFRARSRILTRLEPRGPLVLAPETPRPFTSNAPHAVGALLARGCEPHFPSRLGPVPAVLDETYPFAQSLEPPLGPDELKAQRARLEEIASAWGASVLDESEALALAEVAPADPSLERVRAVAGYQFGKEAARALLDGEVALERSPATGKVRMVKVDGEHVLSLRARDGFFSLKLAGARRIHGSVPRPQLRLRVNADSAPFNAQGKSVFARFVVGCDKGLRPGDECIVVDPEDALVGCAQILVSAREAVALLAGPIAKMRHGVAGGDEEPEADVDGPA